MTTQITHSPEETQAFAAALAAHLAPGDVLAFIGGLGAGKTTFTAGLARGLGLTAPVCSPTFAIVNEYTGNGLCLCHFDMYRITCPEALYETGFYDYLARPDCILAVEWSENIAGQLPPEAITVELRRLDEDTREILVKGKRF